MQEIKINDQLTWLSFNVEDLRNTSELATYGIDLETLQYAKIKTNVPIQNLFLTVKTLCLFLIV